MSLTRGRLARWGAAGLIAMILAASTIAGAVWLRERSRRLELAEARRAMAAGRLDEASERLRRLAGRWAANAEILLLLGESELRRGSGDSAQAIWRRVPASSPLYPRAALLRASQWIDAGSYGPAEELLEDVIIGQPADAAVLYELERALIRVYRLEGRIDDVRRVLRASWCRSPGRSPDPPAVLRELWLLDHAPVAVEAWERMALETADGEDERVWLGRANHAILTGRYDEAAAWLGRAIDRRPDDLAVWQAKLSLASAVGDVDGLRRAATHLPSGVLEPGAIQSLRVGVANRLGLVPAERRELEAWIRLEPGNARALDRLALLSLQAGGRGEAEELRRRKGEIDRALDRVNRLLLNGDPAPQAEELARLCRALGRGFDAQAWALVAEARAAGDGGRPPAQRSGDRARTGPAVAFPPALLRRATALSSPYGAGSPSGLRPAGPSLAGRFADLRPSEPRNRDRPPPRGEDRSDRFTARFDDDAGPAGLRFTFDNGRTERRLLPETMSGGVGLLDLDGDGRLDVYCVQGGPLRIESPDTQALAGVRGQRSGAIMPGDRLFRNRGDGTFEDVSERSQIAAIGRGRGYGMGVAVGDYDNDGDPDLFVSRLESYALYRNRGDGTFEEVTDAAGLGGRRDHPSSAALADLDGDGDLDLYVCHYTLWDPAHPVTCRNDRGVSIYCDPSRLAAAPDHAFRNDGGRFVDVTAASGLAEAGGRGLGVVAADLDDDGRIDLFVANDGSANNLFHNRGGFRFEDVALEAGVTGNAGGGYQAGMGVACGDLDGDGRPDLLVTNFYGEGTTCYQNLGGGLFADRSGATGIGLASRYLLGFGIALADLTNAGRPDVLIANGHVNDNRPYYPYAMPCRLYANRPDGRLVDVSASAGECWQVPRVGRGLAVGDLDNDGRLDAVILSHNEPLAYFHNRSERVGHFVTFRLEGTASNRDGVGARVTIAAGGRRQVAQRIGGGSYQSANDPRLHFGLGHSERVDSVEVRWPSGRVDRHEDLPAGRGYLLREGEARPRPLAGFAPRAASSP